MAEVFTADVVIVGAGPAGLVAAIAAADEGARVLLLEAADVVGGTGAWSGGALWVPGNAFLDEAGVTDSVDQALSYMRACSPEGGEESLYRAYLEMAPAMVTYLNDTTPLTLTSGTMPDYEGGREGGIFVPGASRSVAPDTFNLNDLGEHSALVRRSPHGTMPYSFPEFAEMDASLHPERIDQDEYRERLDSGLVGWGEALAAGLLAGVLDRGVEIHVNCRATALIADGKVSGVEAATPAGTVTFKASRAVILATGGFEWNEAEMAKHFPVHIEPATVPTNRGDGLKMARDVGAALGNLDALWGWPAYTVPGELQDDGSALIRTGLIERVLPHLICINGKGERFVDETFSYHRIVREMLRVDEDGETPNLPAFHIFDSQFRQKYAFGPALPGTPDPEWLTPYESLDDLAEAIGVPAPVLKSTVYRFNEDVEKGAFSDISKGTGGYAAFFGDPENDLGPNIGTIKQAPFYAVEMIPSTIGTSGGARFNEHAQVIRDDGTIIPGLYAAGNVTAAFSGSSYFGPGGTIGPAMVFGMIAGRHAAKDN